ncbi:glycine betaine/L-proline transporter ProP [Entomobacter blattae]|nr:glycine betaine/L-proline transporter ProP [Entomobacter blattae]
MTPENSKHWHYGYTKKNPDKGDITLVDTNLLNKAVSAAALGNAMEWFDFGVYGYMAATIGKVFFPSQDPVTSLISTFGAFTVAFVVRPIGGMVFGPLGDRYGRHKILALTMILMALGTFCIGLIPSYNSIGLWAPILLLLARLIQGFSTGGEYGGAATFIAEFSTDDIRGKMGSWLEVGTLVGYIAGAGIVTLITTLLDEASLLSWGWRIPFMIAAPIGLLGLYMRVKLEETPAFKSFSESKADTETPRLRFSELLKTHGYQLIKCMGLVILYGVTDYMVLTYMPSYLTIVAHHSETAGLVLILIVMFIMMPFTLWGGMLSDKLGRKPVIASGCVAMIVLAIPCFMGLASSNLTLVLLSLFTLGIILSCFIGTMPATLPSLFHTPIRYSALAMAFNLTISIFGGTTPLLTSWLVKTTGDTLVPAYYLMGAGLVGLITVCFIKETAGKPLRGSPPSLPMPKGEEAL